MGTDVTQELHLRDLAIAATQKELERAREINKETLEFIEKMKRKVDKDMADVRQDLKDARSACEYALMAINNRGLVADWSGVVIQLRSVLEKADKEERELNANKEWPKEEVRTS